MRTPTADLLHDLRQALDALGCRWYVFGAQAVLLYGRPRLTADVDVTVEIAFDRVPSLVAALRERSFELRVRDAEAFAAQAWVLPFLHARTGIPLDVVLAGSALEARFLDRAQEHDLGGTTVPVVTPEDLLVAKILASRPKDLEDVVGILCERRDQIDLTYVRGTLRELEAALDQTDLLDALRSALRRAEGPTAGR